MPVSLVKIRQSLASERIDDVAAAVAGEWGHLAPAIRPGMRVAITAGSRGISGIVQILRAVVAQVRAQGAEPFLVAAMGSHGGGTATGQAALLEHLGITPETVGCSWEITDEAVAIGTTADGHVLWCDAAAARADGILLVNRIKPHTSFQGRIGSGLQKMLTVGLGKVPGASQVHKLGPGTMEQAIRSMGQLGLTRLPVLGGLAILENGYDETCRLQLLRPEEIAATEPELLAAARGLMPGLPVPRADLLIVEEMGKNYSGTGMDVNVIGRWRATGMPEPDVPDIARIVVLRLSAASGGNANGIGLADFVTRRLVAAVDWPATYLNVFTTGFLARAFTPLMYETDEAAIQQALATLCDRPQPLRVIRIHNTLHLAEMWVSAPVLADLGAAGKVGITVHAEGAGRELAFAADGVLLPAE